MDTSENPRGTDVGQSGYPEEQQPGTQPGGGERSRDKTEDDAPDTSSSQDSGPEKSTGNPGAAGGD